MMWVKANVGLKVPMEGKPNDYITEDTAIEVPDSAYYMRRLADCDVVLADAPVAPKASTSKGSE